MSLMINLKSLKIDYTTLKYQEKQASVARTQYKNLLYLQTTSTSTQLYH